MSNLAKGTFYITISALFFVLSGYLINIWLGRTLGPESYGIYGVVIALLTAINLFQTSGLPQATSKFISSQPEKEDEILKSSLKLQVLSTLTITFLYFLFADMIARLLNDGNLASYIRLSSLVIPFYGIYALYYGYYNGVHQFKKQALISAVYAIAKLFLVIGLGYFFYLYGVIFGFILAPIIALCFGLRLPQKTNTHFSYKKLIYFSLPLIGFSLFSILEQSIDLFLSKLFLSQMS